MNKLLIAALVGTLATTSMIVTTDAFAATTDAATTPKAAAKRPAPAKRLIKRKPTTEAAAAAKTDPIPEGSEKWSCKEGLAFYLKGDMKRDAVVTVHWAQKDYRLPRQDTTTGADRFHDARDRDGPGRDPDEGNVVLGQGRIASRRRMRDAGDGYGRACSDAIERTDQGREVSIV